MDFYQIFIIVCFVVIKGINGMPITSFSIIPNVPVILGPSSVKLICSYIPDAGDIVFLINIQANISNGFTAIAFFYPPVLVKDPIFATGGNYLKDRVNLTNPTSSSTQAIMTFNEIRCEDEKQYKCLITFDSFGTLNTVELTTSIVVKGNPAMPDSIPLISPQQGLEEGMSVSFTCTGNVGKPAGRFKWSIYRASVGTDYTGVTTAAVQMQGTCTYNGTSVFTTTLHAEDNKAVIRCTVDQELATDRMYKETQPESLVVYYKIRNIQVTKDPNQPSYVEGAGKITLTCAADGNPIPTYKWYKQSDMDTVLVNGSTLVIGDIVKNNGSYACVASNNYNGKYYNQKALQQIKIDANTTKPPVVG